MSGSRPYLVASIVTACIGIGFYALQTASFAQFCSVISVALMIGGASLVLGGLLGFLFGIPRTLQQDRPQESRQNREGISLLQDESPRLVYQVNTNLEQISDWLTKILVGVGLTQIPALLKALQEYAEFASIGLGDFSNSKVFAVAILIYFLICGFIISYLWTRLYLPAAFRQADLASVGAKLAQVENKVSKLEKQAKIDTKALSIVQRQLNPEPGTPPIPPDEISVAIMPASTSVRTQIFYLAQNIRRQNWREQKTKPIMERTIPIFRALIASDNKGIYHANHGQLGFALKDQMQPKWAEAETELTKAIEIRGPWRDKG